MVKFDFTNPIVTIIASIIFILIALNLLGSTIGPYSNFIILVIGGFIATYFAKERKIRYGLYGGTLSLVITAIPMIFMVNSFYIIISLLIGSIGIIIIGAVFGTIGGFIGKKIPKNKTAESMGYLICDKCGGYYELQPGESPEDFKQCECSGKLKYSTLLPNNESEDSNSNKTKNINYKNKIRSFINFKNKKFLVILAILALIIIITPILYSVTISTPNYTLLGSYNASKINTTGTNVTIPNGTKSIKIEYNLQAQGTKQNAIGLGVIAYNSNHNMAYGNATSVVIGQNTTGIMIINNSEIMDILLQAKGIQGKIKIYTSKY